MKGVWTMLTQSEKLKELCEKSDVLKELCDKATNLQLQLNASTSQHEIMYRADWPEEDQQLAAELDEVEAKIEEFLARHEELQTP